MCGLVATITKDPYCTRLDDWFKDALMASQLRGVHSTGVFQVGPSKTISTVKRALNATEFLDLQEAKSTMSAVPRMPITVGHVRHATSGAVSDSNAHPFVFTRSSDKSKVVGVHNGTLQGWRGKEGGDKQDVDSAWAFQKFAEEGPIDAFEYFNGAFAFIWFDSRTPDSLWVARNEQRPLHYFHTEDKKTLMFASELGMLGWVTERNRFVNKGNQMFYTEPNKIYKFSLVEVGNFEVFDMPKYDPSTTIAPPVVNMMPYRQHYNLAEEYDLPFGPAATRNTGSRGSSMGSSSGFDWNDQEYVLGKIKVALRKGREEANKKKETPKPEGDEVVTTEDLDASLEEGIKKAIKSHQELRATMDVWALAGDRFMVPEPNDRNATSEEVNRAKSMGMYGIAVAYTGVMYDDETSENLGDAFIKLNERNAQCKTYDCLLRGLSKTAADTKYNNANTAVPCVIIGATDGINKGDVMFIIAELSPLQRENLDRRIEGVKRIVH